MVGARKDEVARRWTEEGEVAERTLYARHVEISPTYHFPEVSG